MLATNVPVINLVRSNMMLRILTGLLGSVLPLILLIGHILWVGRLEMLSSISAYYNSSERDVFVGIMCAIGLVLISYRGYDERDFLITTIAGFLSIGVALVPTQQGFLGILHYLFAGSFFALLAIISIGQFTKKGKKTTDEKEKRNLTYLICGWIILGVIALVGLYKLIEFISPQAVAWFTQNSIEFWLETIGVLAFSLSWLTKAQFSWHPLSDKIKKGQITDYIRTLSGLRLPDHRELSKKEIKKRVIQLIRDKVQAKAK